MCIELLFFLNPAFALLETTGGARAQRGRARTTRGGDAPRLVQRASQQLAPAAGTVLFSAVLLSRHTSRYTVRISKNRPAPVLPLDL